MYREKELCFSSARKWSIWERDGCLSVQTAVTTAAMKIWKRALKAKMIIADMKSSEECQVSAR